MLPLKVTSTPGYWFVWLSKSRLEGDTFISQLLVWCFVDSGIPVYKILDLCEATEITFLYLVDDVATALRAASYSVILGCILFESIMPSVRHESFIHLFRPGHTHLPLMTLYIFEVLIKLPRDVYTLLPIPYWMILLLIRLRVGNNCPWIECTGTGTGISSNIVRKRCNE